MQAACTSYVRKLISASWHIFSLTLQLEIMWFLLAYLVILPTLNLLNQISFVNFKFRAVCNWKKKYHMVAVAYFWVTTALVLLLRFAKIFSLFAMTKIAIEAKSVMDKSYRCTQKRRKRLEKILHQKFPCLLKYWRTSLPLSWWKFRFYFSFAHSTRHHFLDFERVIDYQ